MDTVQIKPLLLHVMVNDCTDPDCEIHNIDVACEEQVIGQNELAFWLAGAVWMAKHLNYAKPRSEASDPAFELIGKLRIPGERI